MEHLSKLLNYKQKDPRVILKYPCKITLKIDGNAFQVHYGETKTTYHKRPYMSNKLGQEINEFDLLCYSCYRTAIDKIKNIKQPQGVTLVNFEIIDDTMNHIISYDSNEMYLLSSFVDGAPSNIDNELLASHYYVNAVPELLTNGVFSDDFIDVLLYSKNDMTYCWNFITSMLPIENPNEIEGIVFEFSNEGVSRTYKLVNPNFKLQIDEHLQKEKENKQNINLEEIYNFIIDYINSHIYFIKTYAKQHSYIEALLRLFEDLDRSILYKKSKELYEDTLINLNLDALNTILFDIKYIEKKYPNFVHIFKSNNINILKFIILCFRNKRVKQPLWCSDECQKKVNEIIENLNNNNKN